MTPISCTSWKDQIISATHHFKSGLRLKSDPEQGLVVKFGTGAELVGTGIPLDIDDRIGGSLQVIGTPGNPVILTALADNTVGAGFTPSGTPQVNTVPGGGGNGLLPTGPEVNNGLTIDNDVPPAIPGFFEVTPSAGGDLNFTDRVTVDSSVGILTNQSFLFAYENYVDVGANGSAIQLASTTITMQPTLVSDDLVVSEGNFVGNNNATVNWRTETRLLDGVSRVDTQLFLSSNAPLGDIRFINYLDQDVQGISDDILFPSGTPGTADFRLFTLDGPLRIGFAQGGTYLPTAGELENATYVGYAADEYSDLTTAINGATAVTFDINGAIDTNDLPANPTDPLGTIYGPNDVTSALAWDVNPTATSALITSFLELVASNPSNLAGAWEGLRIETFANDRNVAHVVETERATSSANASNAIADDAQLIGDLAAHEFAGDETERLGFNIRGTLADPDDVDVYKFTATGGTTVFIDIDDTSFGLDTVIELIDVNDTVLARSDNSFAEATDPSSLFSALPPGHVRPLFQLGEGNIEGPNAMDAGMRVDLDGSANSENEYYVRVRSAAGLTDGQYTLSIRLRETDEVAGSTIQFADIRFATNAITVSGAPLHSPLVGDANESLNFTTIIDPTPNDPSNNDEFIQEAANNRLTFNRAQTDQLGNLLTSDRGSLVVTGEIGNINSIDADIRLEDVDVYQVDLFNQQIEPDVFDNELRFVTTTFDIDYADGLGRPNTSIAVYNSGGELILHSRDSNIADDVGRPKKGVDSANLQGGSVGVLDAHIGPVELREGTYFVAVTNAAVVPNALDQFFNPGSGNPNVRLMPINSVRRIADDSLDDYLVEFYDPDDPFQPVFDGTLDYTAERPIIEPVFDLDSIVPYRLEDMRLFVSIDGAISGNNNTVLASFNPFTGTMERLIGQTAQPTDDIALRSDGELWTYTLGPATGPENDGNVGQYYNLSPVDGSIGPNAGDDALQFSRNNQAGADMEDDPNAQLDVHGIAFPLFDGSTIRSNPINPNSTGFLIGSRDTNGRGEIPDELTRNLFYEFTVGNGNITSRGSTNANAHRTFPGTVPYRTSDGPASVDREWGVVDTGFIFNTGGDQGDITGIAQYADDSDLFFGVTDLGGIHTFDYTDNVPAPRTSVAFGYQNVIPTVFHGVVPVDPAHASANPFISAPEFSGLTLGPRTIEDEAYRDILFASTIDGWLYALQIDSTQRVIPAPVFYGGRSAIQLTFQDGTEVSTDFFGFVNDAVTGLAFSHLEESPWHQTSDRGASTQHGIQIPEDNSRVGVLGGSSLYYGFEVSANPAENTISRADDDVRGELAPGGSHGSVISRPFNLEGYSSADKPTLYFTYLMEVEQDDDYFPLAANPRNQNDSFRVFGSGDDGLWKLLATNDDFRDLGFDDEYDYFNDTNIPVQELFDSEPGQTAQWRQARVDLSPLAGSENVKIRFDFSTSGSMRTQFGAIDFTAVPGDELEDHQTVSFQDSNFNLIEFDQIVGRDVLFPAGVRLDDGDQFTITGPEGDFTVTFVIGTAANPGEVQFNTSMSAIDVAEAVMAVLPGSLNPLDNNDGSISLFAASDVTPLSDIPVGQSNPVQVEVIETPDRFLPVPPFFEPGTPPATQLIVQAGRELADGETITIVGRNSITTLTYVRTGTASPGEIVFNPGDSADQIAARVMAQLPEDLGAVYEGNGVITFIYDATIGITPSTTDIVLDNSFRVDEGRVRIQPANGDNLIDGETLTFLSEIGTTVVTFVDSPLQGGLGVVTFQAGDTVATIAQRLLDALPVELRAFISNNGNQVWAIASSVTSDVPATNIDLGPAPSRRIAVPNGFGLINGEMLTIVTSDGPVEITFINSPTPGPPGTVHFQLGDSQATIQSRLAAALSGLDVITSGSGLIVYGAVQAFTGQPGSRINTAYVSGQKVIVPDGVRLTDGETIDVTVGGVTTTITFVDALVPGGPNEVNFQAFESAQIIASRLQSVLAPLGAIISNASFDTVLFVANGVAHGTNNTASSLTQGPYVDFLLNLDIPDGLFLRNGEQIEIFGPGFEVITFVLRGSPVPDVGTLPILYDVTDLAEDLYQQIIDGLATNFQAYIDLNGNGINIPGGFSGAFGQIPFFDPVYTFVDTRDVNEYAIPITVPDGSEITIGETLVITQKDDIFGFNSQVFTLVDLASSTSSPGEIIFDPNDSAVDVALDIASQLPLSLRAYVIHDEIDNFPGPPTFEPTREIFLMNANSVVTDANSYFISYEAAPETSPIIVESTMSSERVAQRLQANLAEGFGRYATFDGSNHATSDNFTVYGKDRIRLYNATPVDPGPFGVSGYDIVSGFALTTTPVPGDEFGEDQPGFIGTSQIRRQGAQNNEVEGVYIDDIIIGFAERGEMVLNAAANNTNFTFNPETLPDTHPQAVQPERQNEALLGGYTLEIRTSDEYGVEQDYFPINLELGEDFSLGRSFDTNDRLADGSVTLITQPGYSLVDGDTFTLSDSRRVMTFEFDNVHDGNVAPGNVRVPFEPASSDPAFVAREIRNAINSPQVQGVLAITASTSDSFESAEPSGNRVELFGEAITVNQSGGRFLKVDLVAEETYQGRETSRQIPITDQDAESVVDVIYADELARSVVTDYFDGSVDTLVAVGKIGDAVNSGTGVSNLQDGAVVLASDPEFDWDSVRIYLQAGQAVDIDVDTVGFSKAAEILNLPVISIFEQGDVLAIDSTEPTATPIAQSSLFTPTAAPGEVEPGAFLTFTAAESGYYDVVISGATLFGEPFGFEPDFGEYQLTIRPHAATSTLVPDRDVLMTDYQFGKGDVNRVRDQGQILISSNFITNSSGSGIVATSAPRGQRLVNNTFAPSGAIYTPGLADLGPDALPAPGSARLLRNQNTDALIPAAVISNNVVANSGNAGIVFAGDVNVNGQIASPSLFGRIVNNTVVGQGSGDGIRISGAASPTILNNIITGFATGVNTTANQFGEVIVGSNAYQGNDTDSTTGLSTSSIVIPVGTPLFQDPTRNIFIPAERVGRHRQLVCVLARPHRVL